MSDILLPTRGIADRTPLRKTPPPVAPPGSMENVVARRPGTGREQIVKRPGLADTFGQALGDGPIQGLATITHASQVSEFTLGVETALSLDNARSKTADGPPGVFNYNTVLVDTARPSLRDAYLIDASGGQARCRRDSAAALQNLVAAATGFTSPITPAWTAMHPSGTLAALGFNYAASSQNRTLVVFIDPESGNLVGSKSIVVAGEDVASTENVAVTGFHWTAEALWLARGTALWYVSTPVMGARARLIDPTTLSARLATGDAAIPLSGAASRIVALTGYALDGVTSLLAAFEGTRAGGETANPVGLITAGAYGRHFRAGVFKLTLASDVGAYTYRFSVDTSFAEEPTSADPFVETSAGTVVQHHSLRFSTILDRAPRGCLPIVIKAGADGSFVVAFTNQGFGPNSTYPPDGTIPYSTVAKFDVDGVMTWEVDVQSTISGEEGGCIDGSTAYPTDIPNEVADSGGAGAGLTTKDGPAIRAMALSPGGVVYVGGRVNQGLYSVFALGSASGNILWRVKLETANVGSTYSPATAGATGRGVCRNGIALDESDNDVLAAGHRNNTWDPDVAVTVIGTRPYAHLWKLSAVDGELMWAVSATQDEAEVDPSCLAAGEGVALVGTATFTDV